MKASKQNQYFEQELARLNAAQKLAVETIEGPVLTIAGPGTGKTHILSARIGNILKKTDTQPHNILCLTFTDAGVNAMRKRLLQFIGPDSHKVHIYTFHSFCNTVIQDNLSTFGFRELEPVSDLEKIDIARELIDSLDEGNPLKQLKGSPYLYEDKLMDLFNKMKSEDWSPGHILRKVETYMESLPERDGYTYKRKYKEFAAGDVKPHLIRKEQDKMDKLLAGVNLFTSYNDSLNRKGRYDFADMINWVDKAFENDKDLLLTYQEQYLYILVDEFQDTNGSQIDLLNKLINYWEAPNVFIVGDDDQSIFEFQGARVQNIVEFAERYPEMERIVLKDNYRSTQEILDLADILISNNQQRLSNSLPEWKIEKNLISSNSNLKNSNGKIEIASFLNHYQQIAHIVDEIKKIQQKGDKLNEVAIIYAKHKQAQDLITILEKNKIPYSTKKRINILDVVLIKNFLNILKYIDNEHRVAGSSEELLYKILHYRYLDINPMDIGKMAAYLNRQRYKHSGNGQFDFKMSWRELISNKTLLEKINLSDTDNIIEFSDLLKEFARASENESLPALLEAVLNRTGMLKQITQSDEKLWEVQLVKTLFNFAREECMKNPELDLRGFMNILERMDENKIQLGIVKSEYSEDSGVNLITAHGSKGLEFKYVFMIDCSKKDWEASGKQQFSFSFPDTLTYSGQEDSNEARRRLFYVGITRAKEFLYIYHNSTDAKGKDAPACRFVDEILEKSELELQEKHVSDEVLFETMVNLLLEKEKIVLKTPLTKAELDPLVQNLKLSPSSLNNYIQCPLKFYYENILRVPTMGSPAAAFGSAVHYALSRLFERMKTSPINSFPPLKEFLEFFDTDLHKRRIYFTDKQYEQKTELGHKLLTGYYDQYVDIWEKNVDLEQVFSNIEIDGVPVTGTIDKIEYLNKVDLNIVDYKTGRIDASRSKPPDEKNPDGGNYWRQVVFYKLLLENYRDKNWKVKSGEIDYIEPVNDKFRKVKIDVSEDDADTVRRQIVDTYEKIQNHDFFTGCREEKCRWCQFVEETELSAGTLEEESNLI